MMAVAPVVVMCRAVVWIDLLVSDRHPNAMRWLSYQPLPGIVSAQLWLRTIPAGGGSGGHWWASACDLLRGRGGSILLDRGAYYRPEC